MDNRSFLEQILQSGLARELQPAPDFVSMLERELGRSQPVA